MKLKAALIIPLIFGAIGLIAFIAFKALIVGKIALVLSLVSALKKLLSKGKDHETSYDVIAHPAPVHHGGWGGEEQFHHDPHHGAGHYRRSADSQNLAYNAYANTQ